MPRSALRPLTVAGAAALTVGLTAARARGEGSVTGAYVLGGAGPVAGPAASVLGLGGRRGRATVEPTPRETASSGVQ